MLRQLFKNQFSFINCDPPKVSENLFVFMVKIWPLALGFECRAWISIPGRVIFPPEPAFGASESFCVLLCSSWKSRHVRFP